MKPECGAADFARLDEVFRLVANASSSEREKALRESCGEDLNLRSEVERLLEIDASLPAFAQDQQIDSSVGRRAAALFAHTESLGMPARIGHFEVIGLLGSGGMGTVYRARQAHPRREVALKLMRPGAMSSKMLRRFEFEADVLARLQYPGIAQVFEAGTWDDGGGARPYFAMELVDGKPLTSFAEDAALDCWARLTLFVQVCRAIEHAHQKGVVHRDLKPENILVTGGSTDGQAPTTLLAKVLDFGIARALDAEGQGTMGTAASDLVGTLPYMSPEQIAGNADVIDTRCDVYALGVILFELLAGTPPLDLRDKSIPEAAMIIAHDDPRSLRSVDPQLAGDLDTIVAKAMAKSRGERYASAGALADDIERHLRDEPITARQPTAWEQWRRFARRNRTLAASIGLALTSLLIATVFSTWMAWREHRASALAQSNADAASKQADRAQRVKDLMIGMFAPVYPRRPVNTVTVQDMLAQATQRVRSELTDQPDIANELRYVLATIYHNLDLSQHAVPLLEEALASQKASSADPSAYLTTLNLLADVYNRDCDYARATACKREILDIQRRMGPASSVEAINALNSLAHTLTFGGDPEQGLRFRYEALSLLDGTHEPRPNQRYSVKLGIGTALMMQRQFDKAETTFREIVNDPQFGRIFWPQYYLALVLLRQNESDEAMEILTPLLESARRLSQAEPRRLGLALKLYSMALESKMALVQAEQAAIESVAIFEHIDAAKLYTALRQLASVLEKQGKHDQALGALDRAQEVMRPAWRGSAEEAATLDLKARILAAMNNAAAANDAAESVRAIARP